MNAGAALGLAVRSLRRHRVRTSLAMLGIVIGIAAVICMVALGQGASGMIDAQMDAMGRNLLMILPGPASSSGGFSFGGGSGVSLTPDDAQALLEQVPLLTATTPVERTRGQLVYEGQNWVPSSILGVGETFPEVRSWPVDEGGFFDGRQVVSSAKVCLVGRTVADNLFAGHSPLGRTLRIKNIPFKVIGVLTPKGSSSMGIDQDDVVVVPWTSCLNLLEGSAFDNIDQVLASTAKPEDIEAAKLEITEVLRQRHRLGTNEPDDFRVQAMAEMASASVETSKTMSMLLAGIASISLIVGGIGIMNIMLVSVTERTREIGLRLAVGARGKDILQQFLMEAVLLTGVAGLVGLALGVGVSLFLASRSGWPFRLSPETMALAAVFSCAVGVFFGLYPAMRAARLDPIEALRYE